MESLVYYNYVNICMFFNYRYYFNIIIMTTFNKSHQNLHWHTYSYIISKEYLRYIISNCWEMLILGDKLIVILQTIF